ncbi:MAG TPA: tripartite tricarboxylate transporter substrate binding protein, partial [Burkholderiaceae bacterium]|nr:tripartite tricarboxylate transporter substrate binding protein [Burkholderiaceae bacterium]
MKIVSILVATLCAALARPALAEGYPTRPITLVVGSSAGSTTDGLARAIGQEITAETKVPVIVDN